MQSVNEKGFMYCKDVWEWCTDLRSRPGEGHDILNAFCVFRQSDSANLACLRGRWGFAVIIRRGASDGGAVSSCRRAQVCLGPDTAAEGQPLSFGHLQGNNELNILLQYCSSWH